MWTSSIALLALAFGLVAVPIWSISDCASADSSCAADSDANPSMDSQQASNSTQGVNFIQKKKKSSMEEAVPTSSVQSCGCCGGCWCYNENNPGHCCCDPCCEGETSTCPSGIETRRRQPRSPGEPKVTEHRRRNPGYCDTPPTQACIFSDSGIISGQSSNAEGGMGGWACYNRENGNPHGNCHTHSNYNGHSSTFHVHGNCHAGTQGGIRKSFITLPNEYKLKLACYAGAWDGGEDTEYLEISTNGGGSWTKYGCQPNAWQNIEHTFTATDPNSDIIIWADAYECIDVDDIILESCEAPTSSEQASCAIKSEDAMYLQAVTRDNLYVEVSGPTWETQVTTRVAKTDDAKFKIFKWSGGSGEIRSGDEVYIQEMTHGNQYVEVSGYYWSPKVTTRMAKTDNAKFKIFKWSGGSGEIRSGDEVYIQEMTHGNQYVEVSGYYWSTKVTTRVTKADEAKFAIHLWSQTEC